MEAPNKGTVLNHNLLEMTLLTYTQTKLFPISDCNDFLYTTPISHPHSFMLYS